MMYLFTPLFITYFNSTYGAIDHIANLNPIHAQSEKTPIIFDYGKCKKEVSTIPGLYSSTIKDFDTLIVTHNAGFFSCCTIRLNNLITYFKYYKKTPINLDSSSQFSWYKPPDKVDSDLTYEYFKNNTEKEISYVNHIDYDWGQFWNYKEIDYSSLQPFIEKYFTPSEEIENIIKRMEKKYAIENYNNICVLFYRGNDKITETRLCEYSEMIEKAKRIQKENEDIIFLIQSDETEFIQTMLSEFPNSFYFKDEIRHMNKRDDSTVDWHFYSLNYQFSKYYLAITVIMSKCGHIICGSSGNCSVWIMFYRNNANNVCQYLNGTWIE